MQNIIINDANYTFNSWASGSLAQNCSMAVDSRISDLTKEKKIFSTQDHLTQNYVRSVNCWAHNLDLTCISPWNSNAENRKAGTLVSPRHIVYSEHYNIPLNSVVRFIDKNNSVVERTIVKKISVGPSNVSDGYSTDIAVGLLDSNIPNITFAKVLPPDINKFLPSLNLGVPCLCLDKEEKAIITDLYTLGTFAIFKRPLDKTRLKFYEDKIVGDSGNPAFLIINNELVLVTTWTSGGAGSGPNYSMNIELINNIMIKLGGGYILTPCNLSKFLTYESK